jgi:transposase
MNLTPRDASDADELRRRVRIQADAKQRDRLRAALLALHGLDAPRIALMLGRSRRFVQAWAYAYRDGGVEAIRPAKPPGRPVKLPREKEPAFKERFLAGPTDADGGVCALRGLDAVRILKDEFGVAYTLDGAYDLLHRLGLSCLRPRPRHDPRMKNDPAAMAAWLEAAPLLSKG